MPISDIDIWRSANALIKQHGNDAWTEAVAKYFEFKKLGDECGMSTWRRIAAAIDELTSSQAAAPRVFDQHGDVDYVFPPRPLPH